MVVTRRVNHELIGATERGGRVVIVAIERFTGDRIELEISNLIAADLLAEEISAASDRAAKRIDGELL